MSIILSPNMQLPIPTVGTEPGPQYATDVNNSLTIVDQHTHASGSGVAITPTAMDINSALTFNNNFATNLAGLTLTAQNTPPAINTIYESGIDLYYVDGLGNSIQITANGGVAGSPGSIANLTSPASAAYVSASSTFVWQSDVSIAANMDAGSLLLRNLTPNSTYALTLSPPAALAANYGITLPPLPSSQKIMTLDNAGIMTAPYTVDGSTIAIAANVIGVPAGGINTTQLANSAVTTAKIADGAVTNPKRAALGQAVSSSCGNYVAPASFAQVTNFSISLTTTGRPVYIGMISDNSPTAQVAVVSGNLQISIKRDGTQIAIYQLTANAGSQVTSPSSAFNTIDLGASAATHTYTIEAQYTTLSGGSGSISLSLMIAYEL